jgi:cbb3-type cytochrome oxidase cytochrome c subunit
MKSYRVVLLPAIFIIGIIAISYSTCYALTGKQLFVKNGCIACHAINGKGGSFGPNLSVIGKIRTNSWIKRQIRNPKLNFFTPNSFAIFHGKTYESIMPANKKITAANLNTLTKYLSSLK